MSIPAVHAMGLLVVVGHLDPGGHWLQLTELTIAAYSPTKQAWGREPLFAQA